MRQSKWRTKVLNSGRYKDGEFKVRLSDGYICRKASYDYPELNPELYRETKDFADDWKKIAKAISCEISSEILANNQIRAFVGRAQNPEKFVETIDIKEAKLRKELKELEG